MTAFRLEFKALTGNGPFPWQEHFYRQLMSGSMPSRCDIPTGLGKTAVIAIWLIALAHSAENADSEARVPRRLVYIVNRRTVVDQATSETEKIRARLTAEDRPILLAQLAERLAALAADPSAGPLAISTLRGQFADNGDWRADPARPAVVVGTIDMIGSRLLFSGYGCGFKSRPLHAGFLGQDSLIVHDEAHLEPAFQELLSAIEREQTKGRTPDFRPLRVMALSATSRGQEKPPSSSAEENVFELTDKEKNPPDVIPKDAPVPLQVVWKRLTAKKRLAFRKPESEKEKVAAHIGKIAKTYANDHPGDRILVFVSSLEDHTVVCKALKGENVQVLTGTMRGLERDRMADPRKETACPIFARFLKPPKPDASEDEKWRITPTPGTVFLVCTSAGEVGIDISADHMVCDLAAFDSMAQRLGRVNRFGDGNAKVEVVHEGALDKKRETDPREQSRWKTLELLNQLPTVGDGRSGSPIDLMNLRSRRELKEDFKVAYSPKPRVLPTSDILFDAWTLTTIKEKLPGRPAVDPYLHGIEGWEPPETHVAWRADVQLLADAMDSGSLNANDLEELLGAYEIKPWETLRDTTTRKSPGKGVKEKLQELALKALDERDGQRPVGDLPAILIDRLGIPRCMTIRKLVETDLESCTVLLPIEAGGLSARADFDPAWPEASDVADELPRESRNAVRAEDTRSSARARLRVLLRSGEDGWWAEYLAAPHLPTPPALPDGPFDDSRSLRQAVLAATGMSCVEDISIGDDEDSGPTRVLLYLADPKVPGGAGELRQTLEEHTARVSDAASRIGKATGLDEPMRRGLILAARYHDRGKNRERWQRYACNDDLSIPLGKSPVYRHWRILGDYRHEFGSLLDVEDDPEYKDLDADMQHFVLHLIAAHHGRARPHFPEKEGFDPESPEEHWREARIEILRRFAQLQRMCGRWGLAYLESLLRAADWAASANPSATVEEKEGQS
ncbi:MAG: type I-G CRISPR-associated helicase/endonuclease Cas3g [Pirellulales bacterium]